MQLPGHTTHRLQPLDVAFFKLLQTFYNYAVQKWLRSNPGLVVTQFQVSQLLAEAYGKAATIENAVGGFRGTGIWPVDRHIFNDSHFAASFIFRSDSKENLNESLENIYIPYSTTEHSTTPEQPLQLEDPCSSKSSNKNTEVSLPLFLNFYLLTFDNFCRKQSF